MTSSALSSIAPYPHFFSSVLTMEDKDLPQVVETLRLWKRYLKYYISINSADIATKDLASDFSVVLRLFQKDVGRYKKKEPLIIFIAFDNFKMIQGLACCRSPEPCSPKVLDINQLLCAPWNIRWKIKPHPYPLHGGGVLLISAIFKTAQKAGLSHLWLHSAPTSLNFYKKLGMHPSKVNVFTFTLESPSDQEKISQAFFRAFGSLRPIDSYLNP